MAATLPPLIWSDVPETTRSFALIVDDPDAPSGPFVHWLLYDIPSTAAGLESRQPGIEELPDGSRQKMVLATWATAARRRAAPIAISFICTHSTMCWTSKLERIGKLWSGR